MWKSAILLLVLSSTISSQILDFECPYEVQGFCGIRHTPPFSPPLEKNQTWNFECHPMCVTIIIFQMGFPRFPREIFLTARDVTLVNQAVDDLEEIVPGDFYNALNLETLVMSTNRKLTTLRSRCFSGAFKLKKLNMYGNGIEVIEPGAFDGLEQLEDFKMNSNKIKEIDSNLFRQMPLIRAIDLEYNAIEKIAPDAFLSQKLLNRLKLGGNNLDVIDLLLPTVNFEEINLFQSNLTQLWLRANDFGYLENRKLTIELAANQITKAYIQPNFPIETLSMWGNPTIEDVYDLPTLMDLPELNLYECRITDGTNVRFASRYKNVKTLYVRYNFMTTFTNETFAGLDQMEVLDLSFNSLTEINFSRMEGLTSLVLSWNILTEFPYADDVRATFPSLKTLYLSNNRFDPDYFAELKQKLKDQGVNVPY